MNRKALIRIPLHNLIDLKIDFAFKQLFGNEQNQKITIVFLNAILKKTGRNQVKEVLFVKQELGGEYADDKQSRLDILVKTQTGELINVEVQLTNQYNMIKRTLYYWSMLYEGQMQKGQGYESLLSTITINICTFTLFDHTENYHSSFHLYEDSSLDRLPKEDDVLEVHFIEMNKFLQAWRANLLDPLTDILARWLLLLGMVDARKSEVYNEIYKELEELAMKDENLLQAFSVWENMSQTPETVHAYQSRLKYMLDEEAKIIDTLAKGKKEGFEEGIAKVAKNMIAKGKSNAEISDATELTLEEVEALRAAK